ncbi:MAG: hypothetical protein IKL82_05050 [Clostridia bacterium]|nr:hypothetical protein [Clostridia bacterium]
MNNKCCKKYKFKFPPLWIVIACVGLVIAISAVVINALRFIGYFERNEDPGAYGYMSLILAILICLTFIVLLVTAVISSYYEITSSQVILRWGLIKNVIDISEVKEIKYLTVSKNLNLTFNDDSYFVIIIGETWKEDFINELKEKFPKIPFIQETEDPNEKK